ncbi:HTH-type transcriptional regulator Ptr1 [Candidatus Burarchaeum australiense]|nr:HTH-type transcriptional regulator Ptr1 [Candidatus Burarchaeum australiense]
MANSIVATADLDRKDLGILRLLDADARRPYSEMAKKLRMSKDAVQYRVERMKEQGVIRGFYAVIDPSVLGYMNYRFFLKLRGATPEIERKIIDYFVKDPRYWWVDSADGFRDLGVGCWLASAGEFAEEKAKVLGRFGQHIAKLEEAVFTAFYLYPRVYLEPKITSKIVPLVLCQGQKADVDELDWKILGLIANDARASSIKIAGKAGVTPATVLNRMKAMERKGVIRQYRAMIDLEKLGYYWYKVEFTLRDYSVKGKMLEFFRHHPNIVYAYEAIGGADLEVEMEVESYAKFREVLDAIRAKFGDKIDTFQHLLWYKEHKITYLPHRAAEHL